MLPPTITAAGRIYPPPPPPLYTGTMTTLAELIVDYHKSPSSDKKIRLKKASCKARNEIFPPKVPLNEVAKSLRDEMCRLDGEVDKLKKSLERKNTKPTMLQLKHARASARSYSNGNFVVSKHYPKYYDSESESESDMVDETEPTTMVKLRAQRDFIAECVYDPRRVHPDNEAKMKAAANIASVVHREYDIKIEKIEPPSQTIDEGSFPALIENFKNFWGLAKWKRAEADEGDIKSPTSRHSAAPNKFMEWSHDNQYFDDERGQPVKDGAAPEAVPTTSQPNRMGPKLKAPNMACTQTATQPHLPTPFKAEDNIVAYRRHLLAVAISPGIYKLMLISEQVLCTKDSLIHDKLDAGNLAGRLLHCYREQKLPRKKLILEACEGVVGIAHKGFHTLNAASAVKHGRRIGDCMVEVAWKKDAQIELVELTAASAEMSKRSRGRDVFTTFETRTDWRLFRGKRRGDWEIYRFAKDNDTGEIPPNGDFQKLKTAKKGHLNAIVRRAAPRPSKKRSKPTDPVYSDSSNDDSDSGLFW